MISFRNVAAGLLGDKSMLGRLKEGLVMLYFRKERLSLWLLGALAGELRVDI